VQYFQRPSPFRFEKREEVTSPGNKIKGDVTKKSGEGSRKKELFHSERTGGGLLKWKKGRLLRSMTQQKKSPHRRN